MTCFPKTYGDEKDTVRIINQSTFETLNAGSMHWEAAVIVLYLMNCLTGDGR